MFFYHSQSEPVGIVGLAKVIATAIPDPTQFDQKSKYFDSQATKVAPRWFAPRLKFIRKFQNTLSLRELKTQEDLQDMVLLKRGSRLSVQPVSEAQYQAILKLASS